MSVIISFLRYVNEQGQSPFTDHLREAFVPEELATTIEVMKELLDPGHAFYVWLTSIVCSKLL